MVAAMAVLGSLAVGGPLAYAGSQDAKDAKHHDAVQQDAVQKAADSLVREDGFPAALAAVDNGDGRVRDYTAGVGDLTTGEDVPVNGRVRAGSNTKAFVSAVVLQLVGEGKVTLDAPIETYLPGLVRGEGIDGNKITVRQLLQHTSGLPDFVRHMEPNAFTARNTYTEPRELLDTALAHKADFAPGEKWQYSNTNYVLAGLLVQKVTGRPLGEEITHRIIRPLGLHDTYWPTTGERGIRGPHPKGYDTARPGAELADITELDPSKAWAAGQLVSTPRDLNRYFSALLGGKVLRPAELEEMKTTVKADGPAPNSSYGLGLMKTELSCGRVLWGHGGDINGYETRGGVTEDGRAVTVAVTALPTAVINDQAELPKVMRHVMGLVDTAACK
ncbi:serine hydrolase domain-containing protein [Streptomyces sp. 6N106]|uniref:serine hydrolase domain-containing protein n=1 Tax=Streptomyces sp. 6N106 TaxID=3457418 RepID=UPI003FD2DA30